MLGEMDVPVDEEDFDFADIEATDYAETETITPGIDVKDESANSLKQDPIDVKLECDVIIGEDNDQEGEEIDFKTIQKRLKARDRARRCRLEKKNKLDEILQKESILKNVDKSDIGELLDISIKEDEEEFKKKEEERKRIQRDRARERRLQEKLRLQQIAEQEQMSSTSGDVDSSLQLKEEDLVLKQQDEFKRKLNAERVQQKRLAEKLKLQEIQEKEELGFKQDINDEDLQFKEQYEKKKQHAAERARKRRAEQKEKEASGICPKKPRVRKPYKAPDRTAELTCPLKGCGFLSKWRPELNSHITKMHPGLERGFSCDQCDFEAYLAADLKGHMKQEHEGGKNKFVCEFEGCDYKSNFGSGLRYHTKRVHEGYVPPPHTCDLCGYQGSQIMVRWHREAEHENVVHQCVQCDFSSKWVASLNHHIKEFHSASALSIICDLCGYRTARQRRMKQHMESVHFNITYSCDLCPFKSLYQLKVPKHMEKVHGGQGEGEVLCPVCSLSFERKDLKQHIYSLHRDSKHYSTCDLCGEMFTRGADLTRHKDRNLCQDLPWHMPKPKQENDDDEEKDEHENDDEYNEEQDDEDQEEDDDEEDEGEVEQEDH